MMSISTFGACNVDAVGNSDNNTNASTAVDNPSFQKNATLFTSNDGQHFLLVEIVPEKKVKSVQYWISGAAEKQDVAIDESDYQSLDGMDSYIFEGKCKSWKSDAIIMIHDKKLSMLFDDDSKIPYEAK